MNRDPDKELEQAVSVLLRRLLSNQPAPPAPVGEPWLTLEESATYAKVSAETLRLWVATGRLPYGRHGKVIRLKASDIDAFLRTRVAPEIPDPEGEPPSESVRDRAREITRRLGQNAANSGR